ncbi:sensor histidine kinase [Paenibacillus crassostreae]|uniref:Histidine kinase n=1 Tax=Paenibacillus crassostreae TaxID=1763538 RepID=A0A167AJ66_9BACL|nr:histidine kinase [Paenibacillus crassostreae]AOZ92375.1 two-component sensor histidine kinase [Paenibacillus crassostreae]OAB71090.1 histidine kinase [Paenibacillus crassostreae]
MPKYNFFKKIILMILMMLIPIVGLYFYSNQTTTDVLKSELNKSNESQLTFFQSQVNMNFDLLSILPNQLIHDPDISSFRDIYLNEPYLNLDAITLVKRIQEKLSLQQSSLNWKSELFIYSPSLSRVVSLNDVKSYNDADLKQMISPGWQVTPQGEGNEETFQFSMFTVSPYSAFLDPQDANLIIEIRFNSRSLEEMLDKFKSDGRRDPFYYRKDLGVIYNHTSDRNLVAQLIQELEESDLQQDRVHRRVELSGESYMVNIVLSETTGWYLIDYMPLSEIMHPIEQSNLLFYIAIGALLLMSSVSSYMLYAQVQVPMMKLVHSFQLLKNGDYSVRMVPRGNSEFSFVFTRFNSMVAQIQELFEKVYLEKIHVREARLKQLQSQINPHFFYNCFSFISSMAKLKNYHAVVAMSQNLSNYYRYTTRQEREVVPLTEEIAFVTNYLEIQKMRMSRLDYSVDLPPEMLKQLDIPSLIIQPLVENAVIHGIESNAGPGLVRITGQMDEQGITLIVEDNGKGMKERELLSLQYKLTRPVEGEMGYGLWNIQQRMQLRYGEGSGLTLCDSELGGLKAILFWKFV